MISGRCCTAIVAAMAACMSARPATAQSAAQAAPRSAPPGASALVDSAIAAYDDIAYYAAVRHLRGALAIRTSDSLTHDRRSVALMYLVATEYFRNERDSADAVARRLLAHDRAFAPDTLVFPPPVVRFYSTVRRAEPAAIPVPTASPASIVAKQPARAPRANAPRAGVVAADSGLAAVRPRRSGRDVALTVAFTAIAATVLPPIVAPGDDARGRRVVISAVAVSAGLMRLFGNWEDEKEKRKTK